MVVREDWGLVCFLYGPHKGKFGMYEDTNKKGWARVWLGVPVFTDCVDLPHRHLRAAKPAERRLHAIRLKKARRCKKRSVSGEWLAYYEIFDTWWDRRHGTQGWRNRHMSATG